MHVECTKRERRMSILLSDDEQQIVDRYLEKYKICLLYTSDAADE